MLTTRGKRGDFLGEVESVQGELFALTAEESIVFQQLNYEKDKYSVQLASIIRNSSRNPHKRRITSKGMKYNSKGNPII